MTRFDPCLIVKRLRVERNAHVVYDEVFSEGVNFIRGENSSGKSTVLNFLFYGLGGDLSDWSEVARLCTRVTVEAMFNGNTATLSREVSTDAGQPMDIYGGGLDASLQAPRSEWVRYPYRRSSSRESFSQAIFRLLQMPEVTNEMSGNITLHQVLRLLYADQLSPVEHIFKFERFDPPTTREAIGRLVCGAYDNQMYQNELRIRELNKEFDAVSGELRSLIAVLGASPEGMTLSWVVAQRKVLADKQAHLRREIESAELQAYAPERQELSLRSQNRAYEDVQKKQQRLGELQDRLDSIELAIADSNAFIAGLENKLSALSDAGLVAEHLGFVEFQSCPSCFAPIENDGHSHACHLCKSPFDSDRIKERIVALIGDTALQLRQSKSLQSRRDAELKKTVEEHIVAQEQWKSAAAKLDQLRALPSTDMQETLRDLHRQSGYLEREIEDLENKASIIQLVDDLTRRKAELNEAITRLKTENETRRAEQQRRLTIAYTAISDEVRELLHRDLRRQDSFENANVIQFDFGANSITVDGVAYFSASSRAILKSSFFVGLLAASLKHSFFRHPRFLMLDTIEDKGMEAVRSQNFQRLIVGISQRTKVQHQIIFATAMIAPELNTDDYTVGRVTTRDEPTLAIG